jgi:hypothetical protein
MSVEIIHYQPNLSAIRIITFQQMLDLLSPIHFSSMFLGLNMPPAAQSFCEQKDATTAISDVFIILTFGSTSLHRDGWSCFPKKLVWLFVHANDRIIWIIWLLVKIQDIFHTGNKGGVVLWRYHPAFM